VRAPLLSLALVLLATLIAAAEPSEPVSVAGHWIGTWWMGKYEEPIEMELVQRGGAISGRVAMSGYPGVDPAEPSSEYAVIEDGRLDGEQLVLMWRIGGRRLTATLGLVRPGALVGLGSEDGQVTTGLGVDRVR
jgi:hypothetical protein